MKNYVLILCGLLVTLGVYAGRITLNNPDEQVLPGGKRLCLYTSSAAGTFTHLTKSKRCPVIKTFDTKDAE